MAVRFDAATDRYQDTNAGGQPGSTYTVALWLYRDSTTAGYQMAWALESATSSAGAYNTIGTEPSATALKLFSNGGDHTIGTISNGTWYKVAIVVTGGTSAAAYWGTDGGSLTQAFTGQAIGNPSRVVSWLCSDSYGEWWNGRLAHVRVWNAALTSTELAAEFASATRVRTTNLLRAHELETAPGTADDSGNGHAWTAGSTSTTTATGPTEPASGGVTGTAAAALGGITATAAGSFFTPVAGTAAAALGGVTASATGVVSHTSAAAQLGGLAAAASGTVTPRIEGVAAAALGGLTATASGVRRTFATGAAAVLGGLSATAAGIRTTFATATAQLGGIVAHGFGELISYLGAAGPALNPSVWLVDADTGALTPLPQWQSLTLSPVINAPGSCELVVPAGAVGFDALHDGVSASPQRDQEIEVWPAGSPEHRSRWLLQQKSGDDVTPGDLWTFSGVGLEQLLAEVLVGPQATETQELVFTDAVTYGELLDAVLTAAQARDAALLAGVTWDFTGATDSAGNAWANTLAGLKFAPDATLLDVATTGPDEGVGEFVMGPDRVLHAYNFGARGTDLSTGGNPIRLAAASNLSEASRRESSRAGDAATAVLAKGAEGQYQWASDATAQAQRGRRVEVAADAGQLTSSGAVLAAAQGRLETLKTGVAERVHGVAFGNGLPIPGVDYGTGDWILSVTGNAFESQRITQWTVTFQPGQRARGTVRTNDLIADRLVRLTRQLDAMRRGEVVVGTSSPSPDVDDGKAPAQVLGVAASSSAYVDADGATWAAVSVGWSAVTTNADGTTADDVTGYVVQYSYPGGPPLPSGWLTAAQVADTTADFDGLVAGQAVDIRVAALDRYGRAGDWSATESITSGADATPPPTPSTPVVESYLGVLTVQWNGLGSAGEAQPPDFSHVEIHISTSSGFTPGPSTRVDRLLGAGTFPWADGTYGATYYAKLVAVDRSGNASAGSAQDSATLVQAGDGDVSALSIGKLTAGIMSALMTISGTIRTAASGARVELDTNGFRCYNGSGAQVLNFSIPTSLLTLAGRLTAGAGIGTGATIDVNPSSPPSIDMYPGATASRIRQRGSTFSNPASGTSVAGYSRETLNASGQTAGPFTDEWPTGVWRSFKTTTGAVRGGRLLLYSQGSPEGSGAYLGYQDAAVDAFVQVGSNGSVNISADADINIAVADGANIFFDAAGGDSSLRLWGDGAAELIHNGTLKSFVIPHPDDPERWLVHGCTESPRAAVEYEGEVEIADGEAVVELPSYFESLTLAEGRHVQLTPIGELCMVAASRIEDGRFTVRCSGPDGTRVTWRVSAERRDAAGFEVEPSRSSVQVGGQGPYRFIVPDGEQAVRPRERPDLKRPTAPRGWRQAELGER